MQFGAQRLPQPQNGAISDTFFTQHFPFFDNRRKIESRKTRFVGRPPLSRLRRRFAPLRGTQRRCAGASRHPSGALRAQRAARAPFYQHEKKAGGGGYFIVAREPDERRASQTNPVPWSSPLWLPLRTFLATTSLQARPRRPSEEWFHRLRRQHDLSRLAFETHGGDPTRT